MAKGPAPRRPGDRKLRPWAASQPRRRRAPAHSRLRCTLSAGGPRRLGREMPVHDPNARHDTTRERPKIDRIACPWLIRRFIDAQAEFIYVPTKDVLTVAKETGGTPYDIEGVEFAHEGERCSFDTILRIYGINDPALDHLAKIV